MIGLGSSSSLGIGLAVWMDDQFTQTSRRFSKELGIMKKDTNDFIDGLVRLDRLGSGMAQVGDQLMGAGINNYKLHAQFDNITNSTRAIIGNLSKSDPMYAALVAQAKDLGAEWGITADKIAESQLEISKAGRSAKDVLAMTEATTLLGAAAELNVGGDKGAAVMLSDVMNTYGYGVDKAMYVSDLMTSAANRSTLSVVDFYESLKYSADIAKQFNIPLQESTAVIAALGNAGLKGSMAGTGYANMIRYLGKAITPFASKKQTSALKMLGLEPKELLDANGEMRTITDLLDTFGQKAKGIAGPMRAGIFADIFGVRGNRPFENLLNNFVTDENLNKLSATKEMMAQINEDVKNGITRTTATEKMNDAQAPLDRLASQWYNMKESIGRALVPIIEPIVKLITRASKFLEGFADSAIGAWIIRLGFIFGGVGMAFLGRMLMYGAQFGLTILTSAGRLTNAFQMGQLASRSINQQLSMGSSKFVTNMLRARGIMAFNSATTGMPMLMGRGANGRFTGGVARNGITSALGIAFGRRGLSWGAGLTKSMGGVGAMAGKAAGMLGRVAAGLFSWPVLLADLASGMLTGKGIFEWLFESIRWFGNSILGLDWGKEYDAKALEESQKEVYRDSAAGQAEAKRNQWNKSMRDIGLTNIESKAPKTSSVLNLIINPNNGDKALKKKIDLNNERDINSLSFQ